MISPTKNLRCVSVSRKQKLFRDSNAWVRGFVAGRGAGKTRIAAVDICLRARNGEPWMGVSPTYAVVDETTYPTFKEVAEQLGVFISGKQSPPQRIKFRTQDKGIAEIVFRTGDKPEQLRGPSKAGLWLDEPSIMSPDVFKIGIAVLRFHGRMGLCLLTFTPKGRQHWTFQTFFEQVEESIQERLQDQPIGTDGCSLLDGFHDCRLIAGAFYRPKPNSFLVHAHTTENPFLPPEFYDLIAPHYSSALAAQELGGEFVDLEGLMFQRDWFRMVERAPEDCVRVRYWDRAATEGPSGSYTAGVLMARDTDGMYYVEHVIRGQWSAADRDRVIKQAAMNDARRHENSVIIYVEQEPGSGGKEAAQQMVRMLAGFPCYIDVVGHGKRWIKRDGMKMPGIAKIVRAQPFAAQCEIGNVRICRGSWVIPFLDEVCVAKGTIITTIRGGIPIEKVRAGDLVLTRSGWKKVVKSGLTQRDAQVCQLDLSNGNNLIATPNHPVWVQSKGFTKIKHVSENDELLLFTGAMPSIGIPNQKPLLNNGISAVTLTERCLSSIGICGSARKAVSHPAIMCTTLTATHSTTSLAISNASSPETTLGITWTPETCRAAQQYPRHAQFAEKSIQHRSRGDHLRARSRARINAKNCSGTKSFITDYALGAELASPQPTPSNVIAPFRAASAPRMLENLRDVYNLQVEECQEYFANDVLVHNCAFPEYAYTDQVDGCSGAFNKLATNAVFMPAGEILRPEMTVDPYRHGVNMERIKNYLDEARRRGR